jgi:membrane-associated phospholipid phosphatase
MRQFSISSALVISLFLLLASHVSGQVPAATPTPDNNSVKATPSPTPKSSLERHFIQNVIRDQGVIWTAPFRPRNYESKWAIPLGLGMAGLIATDRYTSRWVDENGGLPVVSHDVSWFGKAYVTGGIAGAFYVTGRLTHNAKARETGVLAAQALVDTGIVTRVLKVSTQRPRPNVDDGSAEFWDGGDSFPSGHSSTVWSVATVIAYEYKDNPWIKYGAFAAATAVSMSRYSGRNHFLSDIVGGSALGFLIGRYVVHRYHDPNIDIPNPKPKPTTWLHPQVVPYFGVGTHTYGASLTWNL